jgi:hypothetical protein
MKKREKLELKIFERGSNRAQLRRRRQRLREQLELGNKTEGETIEAKKII